MNRLLKIFSISFFITIAAFFVAHTTQAMDIDENLLKVFIDQTEPSFWTGLGSHFFETKTKLGWSVTLKKFFDYYDPRLYALVISLSILNIGGTYILCKKNSTKKERLLGLSIVLSSIANIALSSYWLYLVDYKIHG